MASPLPSRTARDPDVAVLALGLAVLAVVIVVDALLADEVTLTPWVLIAPLFIATRGSERETTRHRRDRVRRRDRAGRASTTRSASRST